MTVNVRLPLLGALPYLLVMAAPARAAQPAAPPSTNVWVVLTALLIALAASLLALAALRHAVGAARRQARAEDGRLRDFGADLTAAVREMASFAAGQATAAEECRGHAARANAAANRIIASVIDAEARMSRAAQRAEQGLASGSDALLIVSQGLAPLAALARDLPNSVTASIHASADGAAAGLAARLDACADRWEASADERHTLAAPPFEAARQAAQDRPDLEPAFERLEALSRLLDLFSSALPDPAVLAASAAAASATLDRLDQVAHAVPSSLAALSATSDVLRQQAGQSAAVVAQAAAQTASLSDIATGLALHASAWPKLVEALQTSINTHTARPHAAAAPADPDPNVTTHFAELVREAASTTEALRAEWTARRAQQAQENDSTEKLHRAARAAADAACLLDRCATLLPRHMAELGQATGTLETHVATTVAALRQKAISGLETMRQCAISELAPQFAAAGAAHDQLCVASNALSAAAFARMHDIETSAARHNATMAERSATLLAHLHAHATDALGRVADAGQLAQTSVERGPGLDGAAMQSILCLEALREACDRQTRVLLETEHVLACIEARGAPSAGDTTLAATVLSEIRQLRDHLGHIVADRHDPALLASVTAISESVQQVQTALTHVAEADAAQDQAGRNVLLALQDVQAALVAAPARGVTRPQDTPGLVSYADAAASALLLAAESAALRAEGASSCQEDAARTPLLLRDIDSAIRKLQGAATAVALAGDMALSAERNKAA